ARSPAPAIGPAAPAPAVAPGPAGTPETGIRSSVIYLCDISGDSASAPVHDEPASPLGARPLGARLPPECLWSHRSPNTLAVYWTERTGTDLIGGRPGDNSVRSAAVVLGCQGDERSMAI